MGEPVTGDLGQDARGFAARGVPRPCLACLVGTFRLVCQIRRSCPGAAFCCAGETKKPSGAVGVVVVVVAGDHRIDDRGNAGLDDAEDGSLNEASQLVGVRQASDRGKADGTSDHVRQPFHIPRLAHADSSLEGACWRLTAWVIARITFRKVTLRLRFTSGLSYRRRPLLS